MADETRSAAYGPWLAHGEQPEPGTRYEFEDFIGARWEATLSSWCSIPMEDADGHPCVGVRLNFDDRASFETNVPVRFREVLSDADGHGTAPQGGTDVTADPAMFPELTAKELVALGHSLRMTPTNTVIGPGFEFLVQSEEWKSMWEKVAHAINTRDDVAPYRKAPDAAS